MPTKEMCAACVHRACDCVAFVFKERSSAAEFSQSQPERIPGTYCEAAAWRQIFHALRTRGPGYIGGEVRPC